MSSILRSSKFIRHLVGLARNIVISNRQEIDRSLLQRSQTLAGVFSSNNSLTSSLQSGSSLDQTIRRLDEDARRTGRISMKEIEEALHKIRSTNNATSSQSLMMIRCCGNLVPEETPENRTQLVNEIWKTLEKLGVSLDISHYNALLKVYLENEHKFSPTEFLAKLEKQGVEPNRVTYQRLVAGYCQIGDIAGATKILEFMKEKQLPVSEGVFNALVLGHSQSDDMESAEGMLGVMKQANLEPSEETYCTLMCGYARRGDKAALERLITECKIKDVYLSDRDFLEIAYTAAINGHEELVDQLLTNIRGTLGYNQDAANVLLRLITHGKDEVAYKVFLTMNAAPNRDSKVPNMSGHILIKHFIKSNRSVEQIVALSERLAKDGHTAFGIWLAVETSFHHGNVDMTMGLLEVLKKNNEPIRNHYFWPSILTAGKAGDIKGMDEIIKKMVTKFDVPPTSETIREYYLPYVGSQSPEETIKKLMTAGVSRRQVVLALVSHLVYENKLKKAVNLALQHPSVNMKAVFLSRMLIEALQQSGDVNSVMTLIHIMISSSGPGEEEEEEESGSVEELPGRFLISVASYSMTKQFTAQVLQQMLDLGIAISTSCAELVESRLQGNHLTPEISEMLTKLSAGDLSPVALKRTGLSSSPAISRNPAVLEKIKERMKLHNEPQQKLLGIVRLLFQSYCFEGDIENALRTKQEWVEELKQEVSEGWWAQLLEAYCEKGDIEEAKKCLEKIKGSNSEVELDGSKVLRVVKLFIQNNQLDEAIKLLKSVKPRGDKSFQTRALCWQALQTTADTTQDPEKVKQLLKALVEENYAEINNITLGPIIKACLLKDDMEGALKELEQCVKLYRATPWKNEIATRLIEKEDAVNLQTLVDLSTQVHGEINSLYDLVLSFVQSGRIRQARKILETPGLRSRNDRIHLACERYKNEGLIAPLEGLVEATKDLPNIDRSEIYYNLLETYCAAGNVEKAQGLWTQMQDEDVHISDAFMITLGRFLKSNGLEVPFTIPKEKPAASEKKVAKSQETKGRTKQLGGSPSSLIIALRNNNVEEALRAKESMENSGDEVSGAALARLIDLLLANNRLREATSLFTSLPTNKVQSIRIVNNLINKLASAGEIDMFNRVGESLTEEQKKLVSYTNRHLNCVVAGGKAQEELDKMEKQIDRAKTTEEIDVLAIAFPRGGIFGVLESLPDLHEQVIRIVDKYNSKGVVTPANCLCTFYLASREFDKAREMYQRYNLANCSRFMFQNILTKARVTQDPALIEELISLIKDAPSTSTEVKALLYSNLINIYLKKDEVTTAMSKLEEGLASIPIENFRINTLSNLKQRLESQNIPFKYTIPSVEAKDSSSSSSSSSDAEPKKSVAAKH